MIRPLLPAEIEQALASLPGWSYRDGALCCEARFASFRAAIAFIASCVDDIDRLDHHPEWCNVYNRVRIRLTTHDAGNQVTERDVALARCLQERLRAALPPTP
ncbi:MAG: 4a-hydroxytetrahydrobiopterin dehydratase [Planctomycetota bacterium]|nr:4a-hydroxytetrahydrobiopterin dehydratase [Planctomycetota bacterium]MCX8040716.1 4a-hydroxytetrahydrobiopterin dehydratase [Planctomycetota bacterium]MDW8372331.1 4a-hydroxytetrahydrobiopterin dehydratase [Planctomycetota bacterium]